MHTHTHITIGAYNKHVDVRMHEYEHGYVRVRVHVRVRREGADMHTPAIDALAARGVKLAQHYVGPLCSPTRSQFLTGRYGAVLGLRFRWHNESFLLPAVYPS